MDSRQYPPPPPPERCSLSTRLVLPALAATVALAALILTGLNPGPASAHAGIHNIKIRTTAVCEAIVAKLAADSDTSAIYGSSGSYPRVSTGGALIHSSAAAPLGCTGSATAVASDTSLAALDFDYWPNRLDLRNKGIAGLTSDDFHGLTRLVYVDLSNNNLTTLPGNLFSHSRLGWLDLTNNKISSLPANAFVRAGAATSATIGSNWTWGPRNGGLRLGNNPIKTLPYNIFDNWTDMRNLGMQNTQIGIINTRWFEKLTVLGHTHVDGANNVTHGKSRIRFDGMPVAKYQFQETSTATNVVEYFGDAEALATAIKLVITTETSTATPVLGVGTSAQVNANTPVATNFIPPDIGIALECGSRSEAVERELLSTMQRAPDDDLGKGWYSNVGFIQFARWDKVACPAGTSVVLPADLRTIATGELFTGTYDPATHATTVAKGFKSVRPSHQMLLEYADITDSNGALKPDDFKNLFNINNLRIRNVKVEDIPADTFEHMPNLSELQIYNALLEDDDLTSANSFLQHFKDLKSLYLNGNLLTEFDASTYLPASVRSTLVVLHIPNNPIKETDLDGLEELRVLYMQNTHITKLDPAILNMHRLQQLWWTNPFLTNEGIDPGADTAATFAKFPSSILVSQQDGSLGNPFYSDDPVIQAAAVQTQLDHAARIKAINDASSHNSKVHDRFLGDPCRPYIGNFQTFAEWEDASEPCLTSAQIGNWVNDLETFKGLNFIRSLGLDLSDTQTEALLDNIEGNPISQIMISGAPDAFGDGFDNSKLEVFGNFAGLQAMTLRLLGTQINLDQLKIILNELEAKFEADDSATSHRGLYWLDLSYSPQLFAGATPASVADLLDGVTITNWDIWDGWADLWLMLRDTGLTFPVLKSIIDSMDDHEQLRVLDVSSNPGLWTDADGNPIANSDITDLFAELRGLVTINVGNTGMTAAQAEAMFDALGTGDTPVGTDGGDGVAMVKHPLARMGGLGIHGIDLSTVDLDADFFSQFDEKYDTSQGSLQALNLSNTKIDFSGLQEVIAGFEAGDSQHQVMTRLHINQSGEIWKSIDTPAEFTALTALFAKLTNLRYLGIQSSSLPADPAATPPTPASHFTLEHLNAILEGLDQADDDNDDQVGRLTELDLRGNTQLFAPLTDADGEVTETAAQHAARLAPIFAKAPLAILRSANTGITQQQLNAIITANEDLRERLREGGAVRMSATPPPKNAAAQSGRRSLKIVFTHEPRAILEDVGTITQTGYQYRFRPVPTDASAPWTEPWRTLTLDLTETGEKSFNIHALEPEAAYQIQLRASGGNAPSGMTAASGTIMLRGGTILDLPQINSISPEVTEVSLRAGDTIRLSVNIFGLADNEDNDIVEEADSDLIFRWSETSTNTGGSFADPNHERRVIYTAPGLPGTYTVMAEAQPDGVCSKHHATDFGITDADRAECQATVTVHVSRAPDTPEAPKDPINPGGLIPTSLTDNAGTAYAVFLPVEGGTFTGEGITVSAQPGAVPDLTLVGVAASPAGAVPAPTPGARMTLAGTFFDIDGVTQNGAAPVTGYTFDDPISACLPLPTAFRGNVSDVVLVEQKSDGSLGVLATKIRQTGGTLSVCGSMTNLPATVAVAKLGTVPPPPPEPDTGIGDELPDTGATTPYGAPWSIWALLIGATATLLATTTVITRGRRTTRRTN